MSSNSQNIQVAVRCRPLSDREKKLNSYPVIDCNEKRKEITVADRNSPVTNTKTFTFDKVFGMSSKQTDVYNQVVRPVVMEVIEGYNCTIFAYGQTGTGKTFTMEGDRAPSNDDMSWEDDPLVGIIPRSVSHLFSALNAIANCEYSVKISFMELYNEELSDLLSDSADSNEKLRIFDDSNRKGSVVIPGLEEVVVKNKNEVYKILRKGTERRQKAATLMNAQSSRSHSIFMVTVFIKEKSSIDGEETIKVGKLNLVDLAGSENIERSGATGKRAAEAGKINKSLTTLGRVITALVEHRDHIPYRESNLTRLLQDSLGGKTKTTIIATISPAMSNIEETMSTLDYAHKAKSIRNKPEVNQKMIKQTLIKEYTEEIEKLKRELYSSREKNGVYLPMDIYQGMEIQLDTQREEIREYLQKISMLEEEKQKIEELFSETSQTLSEKLEALNRTEKKLVLTELKAESLQFEVNETKFILEEQVKTGTELFGQAEGLVKANCDTQKDFKQVYEKLDKVLSIESRNKIQVGFFAEKMNDKFERMQSCEAEIHSCNHERFCSICEMLNGINERLDEIKDENICEMQMFNEKQVNWLSSQVGFISKEVQANLVDLYQQFADKSSQHTAQINEGLDKELGLCEQHKESFRADHGKLEMFVNAMVKELGGVEAKFSKSSEKYLSSNKSEIEASTAHVLGELDKLSESSELVEAELKELVESKQSLHADVFETINSIQGMMNSLVARAAEKFESFDKKIESLRLRNESNASGLKAIKETAKEAQVRCVEKLKDDFEEKIGKHVERYFESAKENLNQMDMLSKRFDEKIETVYSHNQNMIKSFKLCQSEYSTLLDQGIAAKCTELDKASRRLQSNMNKYKQETAGFVEKYISKSIETEFSNTVGIINQTLTLTETTQKSYENLNENIKEFLSSGLEMINGLVENEIAEYEPTGNTPKNKIFKNNYELVKAKPHDLLREHFRNLNKPPAEAKPAQHEFKEPNDVRIPTYFPNPDVVMKPEPPAQPVRTPTSSYGDKENVTNLDRGVKSDKPFKAIKKIKSSSAFQEKNY